MKRNEGTIAKTSKSKKAGSLERMRKTDKLLEIDSSRKKGGQIKLE